MPGTSPDRPRPLASDEELLERVVRRGVSLRRRRRVLRTGVVALTVMTLVAVPVTLAAKDGNRDTGVVLSAPKSRAGDTTIAPLTSTTTEVTTTSEVTTTTAAVTTSPSSTTTTDVCYQSRDPSCGPFRWDPPPEPNQRATLTVTVTPASPRVGEEVIFTLVYRDPDSDTGWNEVRNDFGEGFVESSHGDYGCPEGAQYGPWPPPGRRPGEMTSTVTHTYSAAGTYAARFHRFGAQGCERNPYVDSEGAEATVTVTVEP